MVEQLPDVGGQARDPVAVVRLGGAAVATLVEGHDAAARREPGELVAEHRLGLAPAVQQHQRDAARRRVGVLEGELDAVAGREGRHGHSCVGVGAGQTARACNPPSTGSSAPVT
ncbi:hypothetical protein GCM10010210_26800 [Pseudonocardia hydrocarbonoxydans]|uniref:Uncharacterized protein n=1 Tax=Pseudonocardia hydrocarbonoxydans TaxID=76726 RepID=A0A4Y3WMI1_9PSEU|nr:hypothetical protein PHY01_22780 [Pseudonocardia hydrocarbonoxydans]